jgi:hypothetical protein
MDDTLTKMFWLHTSLWLMTIALGFGLAWIFIMTAPLEYVESVRRVSRR